MKQLDRAGIFKAVAQSWFVQTKENSGSVAIGIQFLITAQLNGNNEWDDWSAYEEHGITGYFYVVKRDGSVNVPTVDQLVWSLGWTGDLAEVHALPVPAKEVQITVKEETYEGRTQFKVGWLNPGDFTPGPRGASDTEVKQLHARFGSLLRAAASSSASKPRKPDGLPF